jgi:hypothetical protein
MNHTQQPTRRILIIANRTCPCPMLVDKVARRAGDAQTEVLVVAPALNSRVRHWVSEVDGAIARAQDGVELAVGELREREVNTCGKVGDSDPMVAIIDALGNFPATEIVSTTHPPGRSNWLERGLIEHARARFDIPVTHLVSSYGLVQQGVPA